MFTNLERSGELDRMRKLLEEIIYENRLSDLQKRGSRVVEFEGRKVVQYPWRYDTQKNKRLQIPKDIRISAGIKPSDEELRKIIGAWNAAKYPLEYVHIQDIVDLTGLDRDLVHKIIIWLVKNQQARLNIDRAGNVVYVKMGE